MDVSHVYVGAWADYASILLPFLFYFNFIFGTFFNAALLHTYIHGGPEGMRHWYSQYFKSHKHEMNEDTEKKRGR